MVREGRGHQTTVHPVNFPETLALEALLVKRCIYTGESPESGQIWIQGRQSEVIGQRKPGRSAPTHVIKTTPKARGTLFLSSPLSLCLSLFPSTPFQACLCFSACIFSLNKYFICFTALSLFAEVFSPKGQGLATSINSAGPCGLVVRIQGSHTIAGSILHSRKGITQRLKY